MSSPHKTAARTAFEVWSSGDLDRLDEFVAVDVVHHDPYDPHGAQGLAGMKRSITRHRGTYPDLVFAIEDQVAEGDRVATRWTATMTHDGRQVTLTGVTLDRFANGKIVEAWRVMDMLGFRRQVAGVVGETG
ncbi:ester cyclase [Streptosporangium fragile]|uniref:Ester cyclase n=1 Tax=Streptosporangium fragile TaxID=46186 RepID=A0ABP6IB11_9ACTN